MTIPSERELLGYFDSLSNWGRWGKDDELGTLNFITPAVRLAAAAGVQEGITVSCAREISPRHGVDNPSPLQHFMTASGEGAPETGMGIAADFVGLSFHGYSITHLDSHSHLFWNGKMYNDRPAGLITTPRGGAAGSIEVAREGIVSRGVLLDVPRTEGKPYFDLGEPILPEHLERCEADQGVRVRSGDILLVRTGRDPRTKDMGPHDPAKSGSPGLHGACMPWLHAREVAALCSDVANDVMPSGYEEVAMPVHSIGIVAMGLWLLDNAYLETLAEACAARGRWEFLLTLAPLRFKNTTGSPVNPIAVF